MSAQGDRPSLWTRVIADEAFRTAIIDDPLGAVALFTDVEVSPDQIRQLEDMTRDERHELISQIFLEVHYKGGVARFGAIGLDGRLGGGADLLPE